jgi:hypothetical protein
MTNYLKKNKLKELQVIFCPIFIYSINSGSYKNDLVAEIDEIKSEII